jgi:hypothetical protein
MERGSSTNRGRWKTWWGSLDSQRRARSKKEQRDAAGILETTTTAKVTEGTQVSSDCSFRHAVALLSNPLKKSMGINHGTAEKDP